MIRKIGGTKDLAEHFSFDAFEEVSNDAICAAGFVWAVARVSPET